MGNTSYAKSIGAPHKKIGFLQSLDFIIIDSITKLLEIALFLVKEKGEEEIEVIKSERELTRQDYWRLILMLQQRLRNKDVTLIFVGESEDSDKKITVEGVVEYEADGVIILSLNSALDRREIEIRKMRDTKHSLKPKEFIITKNGIAIKEGG